MEKGSNSRVKEDYSNRPECQEEPKTVKPFSKKYTRDPDTSAWVNAVTVSYDVNIKPDKDGRLKF
jgi:hypothetical protein